MTYSTKNRRHIDATLWLGLWVVIVLLLILSIVL